MYDPVDGIRYDERDFFLEQQELDRSWKWPLNVAVALHVAVFVASAVMPGLLDRRPLLDNIVTVDLVSMPEPAAAPAPQPAQQVFEPLPVEPAPDPVPEPEVARIPIPPEPEVAPKPVQPEKPISLKPLKRKVKKARDTRLVEEKEREQRNALARQKAARDRERLERQQREKALAEARRQQRLADQEAARARQELAAVIRQTGAVAGSSRPANPSSGRQVQSVILKQYLSSLYDRVHSYWILPEMRNWERNLEAVVVLTIRRDGSIADMQFERKSQDPFFDQFVVKTLQNAAPMPVFPALMSESTIEVGLRFKPGELAM